MKVHLNVINVNGLQIFSTLPPFAGVNLYPVRIGEVECIDYG